jgi:hypothetical protein
MAKKEVRGKRPASCRALPGVGLLRCVSHGKPTSHHGLPGNEKKCKENKIKIK